MLKRLNIFLLAAACIILSAHCVKAQNADAQAYYYVSAFITNINIPEYSNGLFIFPSASISQALATIDSCTGLPLAAATDAGIARGDSFTPDENKSVAATGLADSSIAPAINVIPVKTTLVPKNESYYAARTPADQAAALFEEEMEPVVNKYAEKISVDPSEIDNYPLYRFIDDWYGTRYKWGGNDNTGIDCSAFSQRLYGKVYNLEIMRTSREQHRSCERIGDSDDATEGDLVFFRIHRIRVSHVGVYLANGYFVHASRSQGVVISNLNDKYWRRRFAGCGRVEKDENNGSESDGQQ